MHQQPEVIYLAEKENTTVWLKHRPEKGGLASYVRSDIFEIWENKVQQLRKEITALENTLKG